MDDALASLPVDELRESYLAARAAGRPVVATSPTGSGKSTRVPLWSLEQGPVLVVEPRRVAARSLARRVAWELGEELGGTVGYAVRGDARIGAGTRVLFATPGVALALLADGSIDRYATWILDEFHERRSESDFLLAVARHRGEAGRIVLLSATLEGSQLQAELDAELLASPGRGYPVEVEHRVEPGQKEPTDRQLAARIERALASLEQTRGTALVFLPGAGEIAQVAAWLGARRPWDIRPLHGGLPAEEQDRALEPPGEEFRVVLATNVAESAITVPGVVAVVDSGLERRIERDGALSMLTLGTISRASADQRAGRAGRTSPGRCLRLWPARCRLAPASKPSIATDPPEAWLLHSVAMGIDVASLPWLDRPQVSQIRDGLDRLRRAGLAERTPERLLWARGESAARWEATELGREALAFPLPPLLAGWCLSLRETAAFRDALALSCALEEDRPLRRPDPRPEQIEARLQLAAGGGDAGLLLAAMRATPEQARAAGLAVGPLRAAQENLLRLESRLGVRASDYPQESQLGTIAESWAARLPGTVRLRRGSPQDATYAHTGGRALVLDRASLCHFPSPPEILAILRAHGGETRSGEIRYWADEAVALSRQQVLDGGLGRVEVVEARHESGLVRARWRVFAGGQAIGEREGHPEEPEVWAAAIARAVPDEVLRPIESRLGRWWMSICLREGGWREPPGDTRSFLASTLLGGEVQPPHWPLRLPFPPLPADPDLVDAAFPERPDLGDWRLSARYDWLCGRIDLVPVEGAPVPRLRDLPPVPRWAGWTIALQKGGRGRGG